MVWNRLDARTSIEEMVRELIGFLLPVTDRSVLTAGLQQLVDRAATVLGEYGLSRDKLLIVLDNTETLGDLDADHREAGACNSAALQANWASTCNLANSRGGCGPPVRTNGIL